MFSCYNSSMENFSIGTDIEQIARFKNKTLDGDKNFLDKIYTEIELQYCYATKNFAQHLCVRFCAKEAVVKALSEFDINDVYYKDIEILNRNNGAPIVKIAKKPEFNVKVSLSHCKDYATATAIITKESL